MIQFVDSHCHLDLLDLNPYEGSLEPVLSAAAEQGVGHLLCVAVTKENSSVVRSLAESYPNVSASVGVHPSEPFNKELTVEQLVALADYPKVVAIGETGLDYFRLEGEPHEQQERFRRHIRAAKILNKPLIVHTREAREDTIRILREEGAETVGGVMHCFTEDWSMAEQAIALNFYISFSGIVTFKNAVELQEVAKLVPLDRMLIETDSPYLAPIPFRGKQNQPAYVKHIAEKIAELRQISVDEVAEHTTRNFFQLFSLATMAS